MWGWIVGDSLENNRSHHQIPYFLSTLSTLKTPKRALAQDALSLQPPGSAIPAVTVDLIYPHRSLMQSYYVFYPAIMFIYER